ncbi:MAG TPA: helix-turn-helix domain-containing protein [Solirubrobacteraceae bacterium]|nr:helix-turn-helix domain-containing protein [Solirubrobacteraceae bacterium]
MTPRPEMVDATGRRATGPAAPGGDSPVGDAPPLVGRLRGVHLEMVDAVLGGDGLDRVAELAAQAAGAPVALVVPRLGVRAAGGAPAPGALDEVGRYVTDRMGDRPTRVPDVVAAEVAIAAGDEVLGAAVLLAGREPADPHAAEFLHLAAVASLTEVAVEEARHEVEQNLRGSLLEELRSRPELDPAEISRRARRLGCDLDHGAVVLCAELHTERPRHVVATVAGEYPGALAQPVDDRVYGLLPAGPERSPEQTVEAARKLAARLQRHGTVGLSSFYADAAELHRGVQEAELVLEVLRRSDGPIAEDIGQGTYRLLFRVLASHPEEVRSFYEDTIAPVVRYDDQYATDLAGTLEAYLGQNCNMNATAAAIYAHRHTVAYRLERVRELTGLDPMLSEDRERLGLGLKAHRIIAPRLPR